jgi:hypothetical protein
MYGFEADAFEQSILVQGDDPFWQTFRSELNTYPVGHCNKVDSPASQVRYLVQSDGSGKTPSSVQVNEGALVH